MEWETLLICSRRHTCIRVGREGRHCMHAVPHRETHYQKPDHTCRDAGCSKCEEVTDLRIIAELILGEEGGR
jgi:hypothetical protein